MSRYTIHPCYCGARDCSSCGIGPKAYALECQQEEEERERLRDEMEDALNDILEAVCAIEACDYTSDAQTIRRVVDHLQRVEGITPINQPTKENDKCTPSTPK
jgi:predicted small metal-binding protein